MSFPQEARISENAKAIRIDTTTEVNSKSEIVEPRAADQIDTQQPAPAPTEPDPACPVCRRAATVVDRRSPSSVRSDTQIGRQRPLGVGEQEGSSWDG